jgi:phosphohistidine phosphatase
MELILWRHAEAEDGNPDQARKLTAKGVKQAKRMAAWLKKRLPKGMIVLVSPARRAQETARELTDKFDTSEDLGTGASVAAILRAAGWPKRDGMVVVVGHQPTLGEAAALLLTGDKADWAIKKGAIFWIATRERDGAQRAYLRCMISPDLI